MPAPKNGTQADDGILDLGDLTPSTRPVRIIRDGKPVILQAWARDDGCLVDVSIEAAKAHRRMAHEGEFDDAAVLTWAADVLAVVVPDLTPDEVKVLAANRQRRETLLTSLGWWRRPSADDDDPEAAGEDASTTGESSPDSPSTTA